MATKTRTELKANFQNGRIPTAQHFADLIDSSVIKRDDHFFGQWQPGVAYRRGDVVIYGKSMYMLQPENADAKPTPPAKGAKSAAPPDPNAEGSAYCSADPPDKDETNWCKLDFDLQDDDWTISEDKKFMYATDLEHLVGIGTDCPMAKLHVKEKEYGELEFNPHDSEHRAAKEPELRITAFDTPDCEPAEYLSFWLDKDFAHAKTNTKKGFSFDYLKPEIQNAQAQQQSKGAILPQLPLTLMVVTGGDNNKAEVGIGLNEPAATLHVSDQGKGEWLVNPSDSRQPEMRLAGLEGEYTSQKLGFGFADFGTNAAQGFRFKVEKSRQGKESGGAKNGVLPVVIDENNHLGVGTEAPECNLEVRQPECGSVQVCLEQINPAFAVINLKPSGKNTSLTLGADNSFAVLKTDAPCGFVFKRGDAHGSPGDPEKNINQGAGQVFIDQDGKVGIGAAPDGYELDDCGRIRSFEAYLNHDQSNMQNIRKLGDGEGLDIVCRLHPIRFRWSESLGDVVTHENEQFGLQDYECADVVPEVVRITGKDEKAIALQNLVPVLIKAIQEQQEQIDELRRQLNASAY